MRALIALAVLLVIGLAIATAIAYPALRRRSTVVQLAQLRTAALERAAVEYARGRPGLAAEHEATAAALLRHIENIDKKAET
jgi:hypothetical protein